MSIREARPQNRFALARAGRAAATACVVALTVIACPLGCDEGGGSTPNQAFYTVDDGRTWFADDAGKLAPFLHEGKTAYQVFVWTCDDGDSQFVSHLQRYSPDARKKIEAARSSTAPAARGMHQTGVISAGLEVKPPGTGDAGWVKLRSAKGAEIAQPKCAGENAQDPKPVVP